MISLRKGLRGEWCEASTLIQKGRRTAGSRRRVQTQAGIWIKIVSTKKKKKNKRKKKKKNKRRRSRGSMIIN